MGRRAPLAPYLVVSAVLAAARGLLLGGRGSAPWPSPTWSARRSGWGSASRWCSVGVAGALLATLVGEVAALVVAVGPLLRWSDGTPGRLRLGPSAAGVAVTGLFLFSTVDLLLARHHLRDDASGSYVAAATVAKTVLALPAAIMSVVFPRL